MVDVQTLSVGPLRTNCYLVTDPNTHETIIIDPGDDASYIAEKVVSDSIPVGIWATHGHFDHILAAFELQHIFQIPFYVHPKDAFLLSRMGSTASYYLNAPVIEPPPTISSECQEKSQLALGRCTFEIIETPGHTPGGVCFYDKKEHICFTGDTVFARGDIGDWRHTYSSKKDLLASVHRIISLPMNTILYPGHGEKTSVQELSSISNA